MTRPLRILHVITDLNVGGAETMLAKLVTTMDQDRFCNEVVSLTGDGALGSPLRDAGIKIHGLGLKRNSTDPRSVFRLAALIRSFRPDLVQTWLYHADLLGFLAAAISGRPPVVWNLRCSDMDLSQYSPKTAFTLRLLALLSPWPATIVVNSAAGQALHRRIGYRPKSWHRIPNGFDLDRFHPDPVTPARLRAGLGLPSDAVLTAKIARVDPMKDHAGFLSAAAIATAANPNLYVLLIGRGTEDMAEAVAAKGLSQRVLLLGQRADVDRLLPGLDFLCLNSAFGEGFPNILGEAMCCGVPCIATDVGDSQAIIGPTGLVVPPGNPEAMAAAMIDLAGRDRAARMVLGQAARQRIAESYALPLVVAKYERLYASLTTSQKAS